jgi:hypothetical protein
LLDIGTQTTNGTEAMPEKLDQAEALKLLKEVFAEVLPDQELPGDEEPLFGADAKQGFLIAREEPLFGADAKLDSMQIVSFVADVEEVVNERFSTQLILADERALSRSKSPFRHLTALAGYVAERIADG